MEIQCGGYRFENVRRNAYWHNVHLDTSLRLDETDIEDTLNHLDDCIKHPTIGLIARRQALKNGPHYVNYYLNKKTLFNIPEVQQKNDIFEARFNGLYPKTAELRKFLIDKQRITFSCVKPKSGFLQKIFYRMFV